MSVDISKNERNPSTQDSRLGNTNIKLTYGESIHQRYRNPPSDPIGREQIAACGREYQSNTETAGGKAERMYGYCCRIGSS